MAGPGSDLTVPSGPGLPNGLSVPATDLTERFSRSGGPGGQSVNTSDSRVELVFDLSGSSAITDDQRERLRSRARAHLVDGTLVVVASEHRSQHRNRTAARDRLAGLIRDALRPPPPPRRPTRPSRGAKERRLESKRQTSRRKAWRSRPGPTD